MQLLASLDFKASGEEGRQGARKTFSMDSATYLNTIPFTDLLFAGITLPGFCLFNHMGSVTVTCSSLGLDFTTFFGSILVQITPPLGFSFINISASCILTKFATNLVSKMWIFLETKLGDFFLGDKHVYDNVTMAQLPKKMVQDNTHKRKARPLHPKKTKEKRKVRAI